MAIPVKVPGEVLTADFINTWCVPNAAVKPSDQNVVSSTVLVNDTALFLPVAASAAYILQAFVDYEGGTLGAADFKWGWAVPSGATMRYNRIYQDTTGTVFSQLVATESGTTTAGSNGAGVLRSVLMLGSVITSTTAGNLQLQWAQGTSSGTATIVHKQSFMTLQRTS